MTTTATAMGTVTGTERGIAIEAIGIVSVTEASAILMLPGETVVHPAEETAIAIANETDLASRDGLVAGVRSALMPLGASVCRTEREICIVDEPGIWDAPCIGTPDLGERPPMKRIVFVL